jgi:hypothetical protein
MLSWVSFIGFSNIQDGFDMKDIFSDENFHKVALANTFFVYFVLMPIYWIFIA